MRTRDFDKLLRPIREQARGLEALVQTLLADKNLSEDQEEEAASLVESLLDAAMGHG